MERHISQLQFCTSERDVIQTLKIIWPADTSHVLVTVSSNVGRLEYILLLTRSEVKNLAWMGFSRLTPYAVHVYGLKLDTVTGRERIANPGVTLYSVETVQKILISPSFSSGEKQMKVADLDGLSAHVGKDRMLDSLGSQDDFEVNVKHEPPLTYSLQARYPPGSTAGLYIIYNQRRKEEYLMISSLSGCSPTFINDIIPLLPICHSRTIYHIRVVALKYSETFTFGGQDTVCQLHLPCGKSSVLRIKTRMVKDDLQELLDKANSYCQSNARYPGTYNIKQFYRNKPRRYYEDILNNKAGVMAKYIKDNNGDPYSAINNEIDGLFFSASLDTRTMRPPPFSYFGDLRLFVPAEELFTSEIRMYFADFYCHYQKSPHYVTIVLTKRGSAEDKFCQPRLLELNPKDNPFFTVTEQVTFQCPSIFDSSLRKLVVQKTFRMVSVNKFHVEFLYTEDVNIGRLLEKYRFEGSQKVYFKAVEGRGESKKEGIPKRSTCHICNLDSPSLTFLPSIFPFSSLI